MYSTVYSVWHARLEKDGVEEHAAGGSRRGAVAQHALVVRGDAREQSRLVLAPLDRASVALEETPPERVLCTAPHSTVCTTLHLHAASNSSAHIFELELRLECNHNGNGSEFQS